MIYDWFIMMFIIYLERWPSEIGQKEPLYYTFKAAAVYHLSNQVFPIILTINRVIGQEMLLNC